MLGKVGNGPSAQYNRYVEGGLANARRFYPPNAAVSINSSPIATEATAQAQLQEGWYSHSSQCLTSVGRSGSCGARERRLRQEAQLEAHRQDSGLG